MKIDIDKDIASRHIDKVYDDIIIATSCPTHVH